MIERLSVRNVGPHRHLDLTFSNGVIGIFAANGRGKTSVLNMIRSLLTWDLTGFGGTKDEWINQSAKDDEPAYFDGRFRYHGRCVEARRGLRGVKSRLIVDGEEVTAAAEITTKLRDVFGVPKEVLAMTVFKRQGELDDIIRATPADRYRLLQSICGLSHCEKIVELLARAVAADRAVSEVAPDVIDGLRAEEAELAGRVAAVKAEAADLKAKILTAEGIQKRKECIDQETRASQSDTEREAAATGATKASEVLAAAKAKLQAMPDPAAAAAEADRLRAAAKAAHGLTSKAESFRQQESRRAVLQSLISKAEGLLRNTPVPWTAAEVAATTASHLAQVNTVAGLQLAYAAAKTMTEAFDKGGQAACPTCGTPVDCLAEPLATARALLQSDELKAATACRDRLADGLSGNVNTEKARQERTAEIGKAKAELKGLTAEAVSAEDAAAAAKAISDYDAADQTAKARATDYATAAERVKNLQAALVAAKNRLAASSSVAHPTADLLARAVRDLAGNQTNLTELAAKNAIVREAGLNLENLRQRIAKAETDRLRVAGVAARADVEERVRTIFHRTELPARVIRGAVEEATGRINEWLELFGSPFQAAFDEELALSVVKARGERHSASLLSSAQGAVLSFAFWLSVRSPLPLLVLDEPTAFLDAANRTHLAEAIGRLAGRKAEAKQVLVTTHAQDMRHVFDQVIEF